MTASRGRDARKFRFRLYVAGHEPSSLIAIANLRSLCNEFQAICSDYEIVDVLQEGARAVEDEIIITPTLIKLSPPPARRIFGDLSDRSKFLAALGLSYLA